MITQSDCPASNSEQRLRFERRGGINGEEAEH